MLADPGRMETHLFGQNRLGENVSDERVRVTLVVVVVVVAQCKIAEVHPRIPLSEDATVTAHPRSREPSRSSPGAGSMGGSIILLQQDVNRYAAVRTACSGTGWRRSAPVTLLTSVIESNGK